MLADSNASWPSRAAGEVEDAGLLGLLTRADNGLARVETPSVNQHVQVALTDRRLVSPSSGEVNVAAALVG